MQTYKVVVALGDYMKVNCVPCIGGMSVKDDQARLEKGVHIVVGTPGRVFDVIQRRILGEEEEDFVFGAKNGIEAIWKGRKENERMIEMERAKKKKTQ